MARGVRVSAVLQQQLHVWRRRRSGNDGMTMLWYVATVAVDVVVVLHVAPAAKVT